MGFYNLPCTLADGDRNLLRQGWETWILGLIQEGKSVLHTLSLLFCFCNVWGLTTHVAEDAAASYVQLLSPWGSDPRQHSCRQGFRAPETYRQLAFRRSSLKAAFYESSLSWQRNSHPSIMTKRWLMKAWVPSQNTHSISYGSSRLSLDIFSCKTGRSTSMLGENRTEGVVYRQRKR